MLSEIISQSGGRALPSLHEGRKFTIYLVVYFYEQCIYFLIYIYTTSIKKINRKKKGRRPLFLEGDDTAVLLSPFFIILLIKTLVKKNL